MAAKKKTTAAQKAARTREINAAKALAKKASASARKAARLQAAAAASLAPGGQMALPPATGHGPMTRAEKARLKRIKEESEAIEEYRVKLIKERDREEKRKQLRMFGLMPISQVPVLVKVWAAESAGDPDSLRRAARNASWGTFITIDLPVGADTAAGALEKRARGLGFIMLDGPARFVGAKPTKVAYADIEAEERHLFKGTPTVAQYVDVMGDMPRSSFVRDEFDITSVVITNDTFARDVGPLTEGMYLIVAYFPGSVAETQKKADAFARSFRSKYKKWADDPSAAKMEPWEIELNMSRFALVQHNDAFASYSKMRPAYKPSREIEI